LPKIADFSIISRTQLIDQGGTTMRRIAELDGLRGIAAMLIVAYHLFMDYLPGCWAAVDVFFVLSGFLITGIVLQHGLSARFLTAFYLRRGLRIWPIYYMVIAILLLCRLGNTGALPYYLTYTQHLPWYWGSEMPAWPLMQHTWTLALEEQFYVIWPVLVLLTGRRISGILALGLVGAAILARFAGVNWWLLAGRCDGFALGGLLAVILADPSAETGRKRAMTWGIGLGTLAMLLVALMAATGRLFDVGGPITMGVRTTVASLGSFALVAFLICHSGHPLFTFLRSRPLVYLGTISYGIYLYHHPIVQSSQLLSNLIGVSPGPALYAIECALTLGVAALSWHLVERPILRLKDRIAYQSETDTRAGQPATMPGLYASQALGTSAAS
jgi:peptidoglycan/LPS O-acetylase OafA/YrhL